MPELVAARLDALLRHCGLPLGGDTHVVCDGPAPGCRPAVGEAAAVALAAVGTAVAYLWQTRAGAAQRVTVTTRRAAASLRSFAHLSLDGRWAGATPADGSPLARFYRTRDGRMFFVHGVLPHLARGTLDELGVAEADAVQIAGAVAQRDALELEQALAARGMCGAFARTPQEWDRHAQQQANRHAGPVQIVRIGDAPPRPLGAGPRPLSGVRVLDLTRILAGPTCGRTLAEHGAEVLLVSGPRLPSVQSFVLDTGHGKRSAWLDLDEAADRGTLALLVAGADVFSQSFRAGSLARRGFAPSDLATLRPGIVCVSVNCYGHDGPWARRPGWDQLAAAVTGLATLQGGDAARPEVMNCAACDYVTGYLAALGVCAALERRAREGGSWEVRVSLAQTAMWLRDFAPPHDLSGPVDLSLPDDFFVHSETPQGRLRHLGSAIEMASTPPFWALPAVPLGQHPARWLA